MKARWPLSISPATGQLVAGGVKEQTRQVLRNVEAVLEAGMGSGRYDERCDDALPTTRRKDAAWLYW